MGPNILPVDIKSTTEVWYDQQDSDDTLCVRPERKPDNEYNFKD